MMKEDAIAGVCAGVVGTILGFPLDTIKTRMQTGQISILPAIRSTYSEQGIIGFYRGIASPLVALTILNTMNFSVYAYNCQLLGLSPNRGISHSSPSSIEWLYGLAGALGGPLAAVMSTPFELIKTKMQIGKSKSKSATLSHGSVQSNNSIQMVRSIFRTNGLQGLYQGHIVNTAREILFLSTYFITYENTKNFFLQLLPAMTGNTSTLVAIPVAGGVSGAIGWFVSFPLDNIKSNIQTLDLTREQLFHRKKAIMIGKELLEKRGILGLYSGILPSIVRAFIVSASRFSTYEYVLSLLR